MEAALKISILCYLVLEVVALNPIYKCLRSSSMGSLPSRHAMVCNVEVMYY